MSNAENFIEMYGLEKARDLCFHYDLERLSQDDSYGPFILQEGHWGWKTANADNIRQYIDDIIYEDVPICDECGNRHISLPQLAKMYIMLPTPDIKVNDILGEDKCPQKEDDNK
jgi:hypothetical protein